MKLNELKAELARNSLSQEEFGKKIGCSHTTINFKLNGKRPFTIEEVLKAQKILKLSNKRRDDIFLSI